MSDLPKLEFTPESHTDFIFRIEPETRVTRLVTRLLRGPVILLMRVWFWAKER